MEQHTHVPSAEELELELLDVEAKAEGEARRLHERLAPDAWLRQNLFNSIGNSIITITVGVLAGLIAWQVARYLINADFTIIRSTLRIFMIGQFPNDELWRLWAAAAILAASVGLLAGSLAGTALERAAEQGIAVQISSPFDLLRRFWSIVAVLALFASFTQTWPPKVGLLGVIVVFFLARQLGVIAPSAIRSRAVYVTAVSVVAAMMVISGTSTLGGAVLGIVVFVWLLNEAGRLDPAKDPAGRVIRWLGPLLAGVGVAVIVAVIPFDGFGWGEWGGLHVNLFTAIVGISLGFPFGILLALGRRSKLSVIRTATTLYIEFVRGVPLISLLLFSGLLLPFFIPERLAANRPADLTLAILVIMGFSAAYVAEIVRGGLQAVPKGQTEAAQALGLAPGTMQRLIVLPQALRAVIPAMVGQFIALFKDTSLLVVVGILEFLQAATIAANQTEFLGKRELPALALLFVAVGFWGFCYTISKESRRLERRLNTRSR